MTNYFVTYSTIYRQNLDTRALFFLQPKHKLSKYIKMKTVIQITEKASQKSAGMLLVLLLTTLILHSVVYKGQFHNNKTRVKNVIK